MIAAIGSGCAEASDGSPRTAPFDSVLTRVSAVVLAEPDSAPLTGIRSFSSTPGGGYLVVDEGRPQVRFYGADGTLLRTVGRFGKGPGEFRSPADARIHPNGSLFVLEAENGSVTRFSPHLDYDTAFFLPGSPVYRLDFMGEKLFSTLHNAAPGDSAHPETVIYDVDGQVLARPSLVDALISAVPYWISFMGPIGAAGKNFVVTGNNFGYPVRIHDESGAITTLLDDPPPSWIPPSHPERGAFVGPDGRKKLDEWLRSTNVVENIEVYGDSLILVSHAIGAPSPTNFYGREPTTVDIYKRDGSKVWEDIPLAGRILRADTLVHVLESVPPGGWRIGSYRVRAPPEGR